MLAVAVTGQRHFAERIAQFQHGISGSIGFRVDTDDLFKQFECFIGFILFEASHRQPQTGVGSGGGKRGVFKGCFVNLKHPVFIGQPGYETQTPERRIGVTVKISIAQSVLPIHQSLVIHVAGVTADDFFNSFKLFAPVSGSAVAFHFTQSGFQLQFNTVGFIFRFGKKFSGIHIIFTVELL